MGGRACIRGLRIPVALVLNLVANGMTIPGIITEYPDLEPADVEQALRYAAFLADFDGEPLADNRLRPGEGLESFGKEAAEDFSHL